MNRYEGFSPAQRLRKSYEFRAIRKSGKKLSSPHYLLLIDYRGRGYSRLGLTVSRKIGGAVQRNRAKRLLREFFRCHKQQLPRPVDISIIAKPGAAELTYGQVCEELTPLLIPSGRGVT